MPLRINIQTIAGFAEEKIGHNRALRDDLLKFVGVYRAIADHTLTSADADTLKRQIQAALTEALSASTRLLDGSRQGDRPGAPPTGRPFGRYCHSGSHT